MEALGTKGYITTRMASVKWKCQKSKMRVREGYEERAEKEEKNSLPSLIDVSATKLLFDNIAAILYLKQVHEVVVQ